ncbi:unnamed protein product [Effrenium voratum]|nr:unnamed protein product [Effrenium voratum]
MGSARLVVTQLSGQEMLRLATANNFHGLQDLEVAVKKQTGLDLSKYQLVTPDGQVLLADHKLHLTDELLLTAIARSAARTAWVRKARQLHLARSATVCFPDWAWSDKDIMYTALHTIMLEGDLHGIGQKLVEVKSELLQDRDFVLKLVSVSNVLEHLSEEFKGDEEVVAAAISWYPSAFAHADPRLQNQNFLKVVVAAVQGGGVSALASADTSLSDREIVAAYEEKELIKLSDITQAVMGAQSAMKRRRV